MNIIQQTIDLINNNKSNAENGISNCIPCPLPRFSQAFVGLEQRRLGIITGSDKSSKTQFVNYLGVFTVLDYIQKKNCKLDARILYFALEESEDMIISRYILYLLRTKYNIICNYRQLMSINTVIRSDIYAIINSPEMKADLNFFNSHVSIQKISIVPDMLNLMRKFAERFGTFDNNGKYIPNDPSLYKIVIIDHISLVNTLPNMSLYNTLKTMFTSLIRYRDMYNFTFLLVQQQAASGESLDSKRADDVMPTKSNLADYKQSSNDCNFMLGIFNPTKVGKTEYKGYIITQDRQPILGDNARFLNVMVQRQGPLGDYVGLYTDGPNAYFEELPSIKDSNYLSQYYNKVMQMRKENAEINKKQPKLLYLAKLVKKLRVTKTKKQYNAIWNLEDLPEMLDVDGSILIPRVCTNENPCKKCWLRDKCNGTVPCAPLVYWDGATEAEFQEIYKNKKESDNKTKVTVSDSDISTKTFKPIGFKQVNNDKENTKKTKKLDKKDTDNKSTK